MDLQRERRVHQVLTDLDFPAEKWQILTQAEIYGADAGTRRELYDLPPREYGSPAEIAEALDSGTVRDEDAGGSAG